MLFSWKSRLKCARAAGRNNTRATWAVGTRFAGGRARFRDIFSSGEPAAPLNLLLAISEEIELPRYSDWKNYEIVFPGYVKHMALSILHGG